MPGARRRGLFLFVVLLAVLSAPGHGAAHVLSFEDRVRAQEKIERVYHLHLTGPAPSFEEAVPRSEVERQVRNYLERSAAWEMKHSRAISQAMLAAEWNRIL